MCATQPLPHLSMYQITARLLTHVHHSVVRSLGEKALPFFAAGVQEFGYERTYLIASKASAEGEEQHILHDFLPKNFHVEEFEETKPDIYPWMAQLFARVTKQIVDRYGDAGKNAVREGVRTFGESRGKGIAERAAHLGYENTIEHYLSNYDMGRSELFEFETIHFPERIEQTFTRCPFGEQWAKDDMHEYGILYCEMIDPSIAKGYNPQFDVEHDQYVLREGVCHFHFNLKKN
ncbi:L-2-amino-thiazoline-4-carboxylic acid hydrolase [Shouchella patagoniensis]|uniref:L-2-amino-thiazoline-4-carboxylic acid hydrolase n=1 Tax=Shouchella patagoniensis TaxID=228576 RepID=UPI0009957195|nr:L-2-amino-thiazoline-4-carboxylic acid hydrolase [Shouchella patagoniensis]